MIDRTFVGKRFDSVTVEFPADTIRNLDSLLQIDKQSPLIPTNWPTVVLLYGTAGMINFWDTLGIDPIDPRLIHEKICYNGRPDLGDSLVLQLEIEDISEQIAEDGRIEEQIDIKAEFYNRVGELTATYRASFRIPLTK